ncbi:MAG: hypothetical protein KDB05_25610 [Planctomycetales bacterium]|nr:hypothetical protein [Planctomycetales bacterium]
MSRRIFAADPNELQRIQRRSRLSKEIKKKEPDPTGPAQRLAPRRTQAQRLDVAMRHSHQEAPAMREGELALDDVQERHGFLYYPVRHGNFKKVLYAIPGCCGTINLWYGQVE